MFTNPQKQLEKVIELNKSLKWGFTQKQIEAVSNIPEQSTSNLTTVVLVPYFSSLGKTVDTLWTAIEKQATSSWKKSDITANNIRLYKGTFPKKHLKWVTLDVGTHRNTSPNKMKQTDNILGGVEVLACTLLHPEWVKAMDGTDVPYVDLPAIEFKPGFGEWSHSLDVDGRSDGSVDFGTHFAGYGYPFYAGPVVVSGSALGTQLLGASEPLDLGSDLTSVTKDLKVLLDKEYKQGWNDAVKQIKESVEEK